jgi:hypothetical protein
MERKQRGGPVRKLRLRTLADLDKRTTAARAALELRDAITSDLGGDATLTAMKRAIVHNSAVLGAMLEDMAIAYLAGEGADLSLYATLANAQRRLLADLGLERSARDVTPSLHDYLKDKRGTAGEAA